MRCAHTASSESGRRAALHCTTILPRKIIKVDEKVLLWHNLKDAEKDNIRIFFQEADHEDRKDSKR